MINTLKAMSATLLLLLARLADGDTRNDDGQATAEYALVLLGAAAIAMAIVSWVTNMNPIEMLLDRVLGGLLKKVF